jgi:hypothetical protein
VPNRILKESICTSDRIDTLSLFEEVLYYRLIVSCDDYGRFDGRPAIIKNRLFPLKENLTIKNVSAAINTLARAGLVALYEFEGKPFLYLPTWNEHQNIRAKKSRYPSPEDGVHTSEIICKQMHTDASKCSRNPIQSESNPNTNTKAKSASARTDADCLALFDGELRKTVDEWLAYKAERKEAYKPVGLRNLCSEIRNQAEKHGTAAVIATIRKSMASGWKGIWWEHIEKIPVDNTNAKHDVQGELTDWEKDWLDQMAKRKKDREETQT